MILTDREIQLALETGQIDITPRPEAKSYSSTTVDLRLSPKASRWTKKNKTPGVESNFVINPYEQGYSHHRVHAEYGEAVTIPPEGLIFEPGQFLLGYTEEVISLPYHARVAARVEGKSSLARLAVGIHVTAPTIQAGFDGPIQLEILNHSDLRVRLTPGMKICQLIFEQTLGTPDKGYSGQFLKQQPVSSGS
jgi:dCTP deaminase